MRHVRFAIVAAILIAGVASNARAQADSARARAETVAVAPLVRAAAALWGASVFVIDSAEIANSTAPTFSQLLQARLPGLHVLRSGGTASDGSLVMLGGPISLIGPSAPILIVDGVRLDSRQFDNLGLSAVSPSRLDDLAPDDIERVEVLEGPAAALYGDGAAGGVLIVTTKSGGSAPLRLTGRVQSLTATAPDNFPANYRRVGTSPATGQPVADCGLLAVAEGRCTPTGLDVWNPLQQASRFRTATAASGHVALTGTASGTSVYIGATGTHQPGVLPHDESSRLGFRGKIARDLRANLTAELTGGYLRDNARLAVDGGWALASNVIANGLFGGAANDANHGYASQGPDSIYPDRGLRHKTIGASVQWRPLGWLHASVTTARDEVTEQWRSDYFQPSINPFNDRTEDTHETTGSAAQLSADYHLRPTVVASSGLILDRQALRTTTADTVYNPPVVATSLTSFHQRSTALSVIQSLQLSERLTVNASLQRVTSTIFGGSSGKEWFPGANISWQPQIAIGGVSSVRVHAAYAEAAGATESLTSFATIVVPGSSAPVAKPKMERTKHRDVGVDATWGRTTTASVNVFQSLSTNLFLPGATVFPPIPAVSQPRVEMRNSGVEMLLRTTLLDASPIRWQASLSLSTLQNRVSKLNAPTQLQLYGAIREGSALDVPWARPFTFADANHDGIIDTSEVQLGAISFVGQPLPALESALATSFELPAGLRISAVADYRHGYKVVNAGGQYRCAVVRNCRAAQDPTTPLDEQALAVAAFKVRTTPVVGFVDDAWFLKLREIAVHWVVPSRWSEWVGARANVTIAARNVATSTNYRGLDPEVSSAAPDVLPRQEFARMPVPREFVLRLDVGQM
jgi:outer membrane receptor protein involved in Fe transport